MSIQLPVIEFSSLSVDKSEEEIADSSYSAIGDKLIEVFSSIGFVYLSHHGVSTELLDSVVTESGKFFTLPPCTKEKYRRSEKFYGWAAVEQETLNPDRPGDLKESYNIQGDIKWPDNEVPGLSTISNAMLEVCARLSRRILTAMGAGLRLENPNYFVEHHKTNDQTTLRYLYYPPVQDTKPGQIRCGEHSDYGSLALLFQDNMGGLQVLSRSGEWLDAVPADGTILVNIGDLMQRWTSDKLVSTKHRVVIPEEETKKCQARRSTVYFVNPDGDSMITCIDGSNKYEPITSLDYLKLRFAATY